MTYFSGFTSHKPRHANFKRIYCDFEEAKPCRVENNTKTIKSGFLSRGSMGLILVFTNYFNQNFFSKVYIIGYIIFHNNDFAALWNRDKVFKLSKNTFLGNFSFTANWKWNFSSFFYGKQTLLAPKTFISAWARVSENWQSAVDYQKCSSLGSELTTFIDGILSKLLFQWVKKRFSLH